jgi:hypothetical protein
MKTLKDHVIVYDDECPVCDMYSCALVNSKMLDEKGREAYSWIPSTISKHIDRDRARNEIALVNPKTGEVRYGIDSLFFIFAHRYPVLRFLFQFAPFRFVMKHLYAFISYNRRVFAPAEKFEAKNSCTPDFKISYRIAFLIFAWLVVSAILNSYSNLIVPLIREGGFQRELLVCGGQMLFQGIVVLMINKDKLIHYLGNLMVISLGGGLLLLPAIWISYTGLVTTPYFYAGWFLMTAALMFFEHIRRTKLLGLHWSLSGTWALYRLLLLTVFI